MLSLDFLNLLVNMMEMQLIILLRIFPCPVSIMCYGLLCEVFFLLSLGGSAFIVHCLHADPH